MGSISYLFIATLSTIIGALVLGIGFYIAFKLRDKRKPEKLPEAAAPNVTGVYEPIFLKRYMPAMPLDTSAELNQTHSHKPAR